MINQESVTAVEASTFSKQFRKPLYDSFCFSKIPGTISYLLTGDRKEEALPSSCFQEGDYDAVVLLFLDAFGWSFFERHQSHPFLQRFIENGIVSKITSQFPSTTAAHVTTVHTGSEVGATGIYEWFQYEPKIDKVIAPLLFSVAGDHIANSLQLSGVEPADFFPFTTLYQKLHEKKVESFVFQETIISQSPYSQILGKGAHPVGYLSLSQGLKGLAEVFASGKKNKEYCFFYHSHIDFVGHRKGVDSKAFDKSILYCLDLLEKELMVNIASSKKTALLVTADHGMAPVRPKQTIYLNLELPDLKDYLKVGAPAGSCRDLFLSVKERHLADVIEKIRKVVDGKAEVWKTKDLIEQGFFGKNISSRFLERVGNVVVLPYENEGVWWFEKGKFEQHFYGSHGGLTPQEMDSIFLFLPLNK